MHTSPAVMHFMHVMAFACMTDQPIPRYPHIGHAPDRVGITFYCHQISKERMGLRLGQSAASAHLIIHMFTTHVKGHSVESAGRRPLE